MSTNYYLDSPDNEAGHLGKWGAGRFTAYAPPGVDSFETWAAQLDGHRIFAEHGMELGKDEMVAVAKERTPRAYYPHVRADQFMDQGVMFSRHPFC